MLLTKFQVIWPFGSEEGAAILDLRSKRFKLFLIYRSSRCFLPSFKSVGLSFEENKGKIDFQDGGHLRFPIRTILHVAVFDLQVRLMLPAKFRVSWPFGSGEEAKNRFSRWRPRRLSWISDRNFFLTIFDLQVNPLLLIKFQVN